jgi:hypothetical protein
MVVGVRCSITGKYDCICLSLTILAGRGRVVCVCGFIHVDVVGGICCVVS